MHKVLGPQEDPCRWWLSHVSDLYYELCWAIFICPSLLAAGSHGHYIGQSLLLPPDGPLGPVGLLFLPSLSIKVV